MKDRPEIFNFDLRRSLMLSEYIKEWGIPKCRVVSSKSNMPPIEVYLFPGQGDSKITRIVTVGLSAQDKSENQTVDHEVLLVLPRDLGGATEKEVIDYLLDISIYSMRNDVVFGVEALIPESELAPRNWRTKAVLVDEPRGEAERICTMHIGDQHIDLLWIIPIFGDEYQILFKKGVRAFDRLCEESEYSLVDVGRESMA